MLGSTFYKQSLKQLDFFNEFVIVLNMSYCALCFPGAKSFGEIYPEHSLILCDGLYQIINSHDEIYRFPGIPLINPFAGMTDEEAEKADLQYALADDTFCKFVETMRETFVFHPQQGHIMVDLCKQVGYDPMKDGWLDYWLCNRAARMIIAAQKTA